MKIKFGKKQSAFTLLEVVFSMLIVGMGIAAVLSGILFTIVAMRASRDNNAATQVLVEKNETLRLCTWDQLHTTNGFIPKMFTNDIYTGIIILKDAPFSASYSNDICEVKVRLAWKTGNIPCTRTWTTYIARNGLQDYIYGPTNEVAKN